MIFAVIPWILFVLVILCDVIDREIRWAKEANGVHERMVGQFECLYPDDPCFTKTPVEGIECDNCVRYGCPELLEGKK